MRHIRYLGWYHQEGETRERSLGDPATGDPQAEIRELAERVRLVEEDNRRIWDALISQWRRENRS